MMNVKPGDRSWRLFGGLLALGWMATCMAGSAQSPERFWLAGRYDGGRIIVYFDAVKFNETVPKDAVKLAFPIADAFFRPVGLSAPYISTFQRTPEAEHFKIGDRYDLLLGAGEMTTVRLTTLVGFESDEGVGNDSFIGALATPEREETLIFSKNYYAVRRHVDVPASTPASRRQSGPPPAALDRDPVPFDVQTRVTALLKTLPEVASAVPPTISPRLTVERFTLAGGSTRYYARAEWRSSADRNQPPAFACGVWITPAPTLRVLALEPKTSSYGFDSESPRLLNVVDLGRGRTGIIMSIQGEDGRELLLVEYQDGVNLKGMRVLQVLGVGE